MLFVRTCPLEVTLVAGDGDRSLEYDVLDWAASLNVMYTLPT